MHNYNIGCNAVYMYHRNVLYALTSPNLFLFPLANNSACIDIYGKLVLLLL